MSDSKEILSPSDNTKPKNKGSRPGNLDHTSSSKYLARYADQIFTLALLGKTKRQMAEFFNVSPMTFYQWLDTHALARQALTKADEEKISKVEKSLLKRAIGYETTEEKAFLYQGEVVIATIKTEVQPDVSAQKFYLQNRSSEKWAKDGMGVQVNTQVNLTTKITEEYE